MRKSSTLRSGIWKESSKKIRVLSQTADENTDSEILFAFNLSFVHDAIRHPIAHVLQVLFLVRERGLKLFSHVVVAEIRCKLDQQVPNRRCR